MNLLISEKIKLLVHKTLVSLDVVSLFIKIVALSGLPSNLQKQDSKLGPFLRTKDFFGCGKSYKAVTPFSQHHTYCKRCQQFLARPMGSPVRIRVLPKSYIPEGQPRSTKSANPSRAHVGNCRQCQYSGLSVNLRLKYLGGRTWTATILFHKIPF